MLYVAKVGVIIAVFTALTAWVLQVATGRQAKKVRDIATRGTALSLIALCIPQISAAFLAIGSTVLLFSRRRIFAAGFTLFIILSMPNIGTTFSVGGLQLIDFSVISSAVIGMTIASFSWKGRFVPSKSISSYPVWVIFAVLTFISARDTSITNILRVVVENTVFYLIPYFIVRSALRDGASVRVMFLFVIAAGLAVSAVAIFESFMVWPIYQTYGQSFGTIFNAGVKMRGGMLRAAGPSMNPPLSSAVLALCFVTTFSSAILFKNKLRFRFVLFIVALGLFCMQSRVGWLGAITGSLGVIVSRKRFKALLIYAPTFALIIGCLYGVAQVNSSFANLVGFSSDAKGSLEYRDRADARSKEIIKQHPLIGQPISDVMSQMEDLRQGEGIIDFTNAYMGIGLFSGLTGLALFVSGLLYQAYSSYTKRGLAVSRGAGSLADMGFGVSAAILTMLPYIPVDYRTMITTILLFALGNAVITHFSVNTQVTSRNRKIRLDGHAGDKQVSVGA